MSPDTLFVLGLFFAVLAIPAALARWSDKTAATRPMIVLIAGVSVAVYGASLMPGGFDPADIPEIVIRVLARVIG